MLRRRSATLPWVHKGKIAVRQVTTLALSFDHRLVDGELGCRFLADVAAVLERPERGPRLGLTARRAPAERSQMGHLATSRCPICVLSR